MHHRSDPPQQRNTSPLVYPAAALSAASLAWTTWSLVDLLGTGAIGYTVAAGADIVWASVIAAEARGLRIAGRRWVVTLIGWAALLAVAALLVWHGIRSGSIPMAAAGPLLPLGAKVVWLLAITDGRDPAALTDDEQAVIARMERGMAFEEQQHRIEMRRREMAAELQLAEVDVDFQIEFSRREKGRELARRAPIAISPITPEQTPITLSPPPPPGRPEPPPTSPIADREQVSIADLARDHVAIYATNLAATEAICSLRPDADRPSVAAAVRRARRNLDGRTGGYG